MTITLNGSKTDVADDITLAALMTELALPTRGSAAVVDGEVVPRGLWTGLTLRQGQVVELVTAVQGG
ncbi:MAG TPA: sulfur carrier protein ThiS [Jatrophihabitans sp.]|nr:sulfur carrier protein ThiS [Jatrophihabitans sp.]